MLKYAVTFMIVFVGLRGQAHALCTTPGEERACFVNGVEGTQVCLDNHQFSPCDVPVTTPPPPPPGVVAFSDQPFGLIASTGNLYWTNSTSPSELGTPAHSAVMRASKTNVPGNETVLYEEHGTGANDIVFGDIVFANAGGFFGYFTATYLNTDGSTVFQIKRIPLAGGPAVVLAALALPVTALSLTTDGSSLFWSDADGIKKLPIGGGTISTLVPATGISLAAPDGAGNILFVVGKGTVSRVSTSNGSVISLFDTPNKITALYATPTQMFWGTGAGAVHSRPNAISGVDTEYQAALGARPVVSVGFDGSRVLWADCSAPGNGDCIVRKRNAGASANFIVQSLNNGTVSHIQWDTASMYWHDLSAVRKFAH